MGTQQSVVTKNTFIDVDTRGLDDSTKDPRQVKSWGGPASWLPSDSNYFSDIDNDDENMAQLDEPINDWMSEEISRIKTVDPMELDTIEGAPSGERTSKHVRQPSAGAEGALGAGAQLQTRAVLMQIPVSMPTFGFVAPGMLMSRPHAPGYEPTWASQITVSQSTTRQISQSDQDAQFHRKEEPDQSCNLIRVGKPTWTCRMLRNIPNDYARQDLVDMLDSKGIQFDFAYLPVDWSKRSNLGYAFVNLVCHDEAERIASLLDGFSEWTVSSEKKCEVVWGKAEQQSLHRNIERFRNSPVMHPDVPDEFKPVLLTLGERVAFPAPTKRLRAPRGLNLEA